MALSSQMDEQNDYLFMSKIDNAKNVLQLLKVVHFKDTATILISANGLKVTVEDAKCIQGNAFIQADMFQEYEIKEDVVTFRINLNALVDCLSIFSGGNNSVSASPALKMCCNGNGSSLMLLLEESGVLTDCSITTQEAEETLDFNFCNTDVVNKVIMKSDILKDIFNDLDVTTDVLQIMMSSEPPYFRLSSFGNFGTNHIDIPNDSEVVECFDCSKTLTHKYKFALLKPIIKPLSVSKKVSLRTDRRGLLCLQFMMRTEDNHTSYVEFFCCPDEEIMD